MGEQQMVTWSVEPMSLVLVGMVILCLAMAVGVGLLLAVLVLLIRQGIEERMRYRPRPLPLRRERPVKPLRRTSYDRPYLPGEANASAVVSHCSPSA